MQHKNVQYLMASLMVLAGFIAGFFVHQTFNRQSGIPSEKDVSQTKQNPLFEILQNEKILALRQWEVTRGNEFEPHQLLCVVREYESDPNYEGKGAKLSVYDGRRVIFEDNYTSVDDIQVAWALRESPPQLVLNVNYGGNANFVQILNFADGKVTELFNEMQGSGFEVRPQFRSSGHPAVEPYQVSVISDGLASPGEKFADLYRYERGKYQCVGKYSQTKVDDYIEKLIVK